MLDRWMYVRATRGTNLIINLLSFVDANTIGSIAAVASIDWGCAVQIMAAANIGSADGSFVATSGQL